MLELPSVGKPGCSRFEYSLYDAVVLESRSIVPRLDGMIIPCASTNWFEMHEHFSSYRCHWRGIERIHAFHCFER